MNVGTESIGYSGMQETITIVFAPISVKDELESGSAGLVWYIEFTLYDLNPVEETY
jgi:hypothetical protein